MRPSVIIISILEYLHRRGQSRRTTRTAQDGYLSNSPLNVMYLMPEAPQSRVTALCMAHHRPSSLLALAGLRMDFLGSRPPLVRSTILPTTGPSHVCESAARASRVGRYGPVRLQWPMAYDAPGG
eukprot:2771121-Prymnesium_polylepis.1